MAASFCLALIWTAASVAAHAAPPGDAPELAETIDYAQKSDHELTRIGARWDELSQAEKSALLREVKLRMAQRKDGDGVLMIRTQRRYGRVYGNGRYLKIETKVVRVQSADRAASQGFGVGYEQRSATSEDTRQSAGTDGQNQDAGVDAPLVRVTDASP